MVIPQYVNNVINTLLQKGYEAFVVGGCVRDTLLGRKPSDWDITTNALPHETTEVFGQENTVPVGISHGTVGVKSSGGLVEVTTYRIDGSYADFRHPTEVLFSRSLADDLMRRDFTVNAMAYSPQAGLIDNFDGQTDLEKKIIRAVGNPDLRFGEDALRIMRALRFAAVLGFEIEEKTAKSISSLYPNLSHIARERITAEFTKLILAENPAEILLNFHDVFSFLFDADLPLWQNGAKSLAKATTDIPVRLALLFENFESLPDFLILPNDTVKKVRLLLKHKNTLPVADRVAIKKLLSALDTDSFEFLLDFQKAKGNSLEEVERIYKNILANGECFRLADLKISGDDLIKSIDLRGSQIGNALKTLLDAVMEDKCGNTKEELIEYLKRPN